MESFWARTGFTPDFLPTRYLKRAEFACAITKSVCSPGVTAMRSVTVTAGRERFLLRAMAPPTREPTTTSVRTALVFQFIVPPFFCHFNAGRKNHWRAADRQNKDAQRALTGDD